MNTKMDEVDTVLYSFDFKNELGYKKKSKTSSIVFYEVDIKYNC